MSVYSKYFNINFNSQCEQNLIVVYSELKLINKLKYDEELHYYYLTNILTACLEKQYQVLESMIKQDFPVSHKNIVHLIHD